MGWQQTAESEDRPHHAVSNPSHCCCFLVWQCRTSRLDCSLGESCVATRSCEAIVVKLNIARTTSDQAEKQEIIEEVRKKVCNKKERKVCCKNSNAPLEKNS